MSPFHHLSDERLVAPALETLCGLNELMYILFLLAGGGERGNGVGGRGENPKQAPLPASSPMRGSISQP